VLTVLFSTDTQRVAGTGRGEIDCDKSSYSLWWWWWWWWWWWYIRFWQRFNVTVTANYLRRVSVTVQCLPHGLSFVNCSVMLVVIHLKQQTCDVSVVTVETALLNVSVYIGGN
jgi:hypothetical protein